MNGKKKIVLLIAGLFAGVGIMLMVIGAILGIATGEENVFGRGSENMNVSIGSLHIGSDGIGFWNSGSEEADTAPLTAEREEFTEVDSLRIEMDAGTVIMKSAPGDTVAVEAGEEARGYVWTEWDGYELTVESDGADFWRKGGEPVYITVPGDHVFETVEISVDGGYLSTEGFRTEYLDVSADAGCIESSGEIYAETMEGSADAGSIELARLTTEYLDVSCDTGSFIAQLSGRREDYDFDLSGDMGSIQCGSTILGDIDNSLEETHEDAESQIVVSADLGNIELSFEK